MKVVDAIAHCLKAEGVEFITAYPVNHIIESAAKVGIRTIIVRQERVGLHMADAFSRLNSGDRIGVFVMQQGPGSENAFGGVAQAYGDSVPLVVLPMGYALGKNQVDPNFSSWLNYQHVTKNCEQLQTPDSVWEAMRRAFMQARNGRPRPSLLECPLDVLEMDAGEPNYRPTTKVRSAPDPRDVDKVAETLLAADNPVLYAGQGIHYAKAWKELREFIDLSEIPITTTLQGKSAFPEDHPLFLGSGGRAHSQAVHDFVKNSDVLFGIGNSFTKTNYGVAMPENGKKFLHSTLDPADLNKDIESAHGLVGDAKLTLQMLTEAVKDRLGGKPRGRKDQVAGKIKEVNDAWLQKWMPKLTHNEAPLSPYRVVWDLLHTVDVKNTIITHDAGSPREQLSPFWFCTEPLTYLGWGKTTQLGYGLGLAMGAKLARPDALCINVWGDAAIGFTGMDFETAVRERIPIMSVLFNNFSMAIELKIMPESTERYRSTDISGNYADMAKAFGGYGERVTTPDEIVPAIKRGMQKTQEGTPVLLEFITDKEVTTSTY